MTKPSEYWKLADSLTVIQAALLIIGEEPTGQESVASNSPGYRLDHFDAVYSAIKNAVLSDTLKAIIHYPISWIQDSNNLSWIQYPQIDEHAGIFRDGDSKNAEILEVHFKKTPDWNN